MTIIRPVCNCPDATQEQGKNLFASSQTLTFDRNWKSRVTSNGDTINFPGIRAQGGYCIHELAVLRITDQLKDAFPSGIPYKPKIETLIERKQPLQKFESNALYLSPISDII